MTGYRIIWEIDIEAESPRKAAEKALEIQRNKDSIATVFTVVDKRTFEAVEIDAGEEELKKLIEENRRIREAAEKRAVEKLKAELGPGEVIYCADCGQPIEGDPIIWMGTSPRCKPCHEKRMRE